jgi:DNA-binding SARP family transcriptional activator
LKRAYDRKDDLTDMTDDRKLKGNIREEIAGWKKLVGNNPHEWTLQTHLAEAYAKNQDIGEEMTGWRNLLNENPGEQELRDRLLHACLQCETIEAALQGLKGVDRSHLKNKELESVLVEMRWQG